MERKLPTNIGDPDADNDDLLSDVFVETKCYREVLDERHFLILGRKGIGKTALVNMIPIREARNNTWHHIISKKTPQDFHYRDFDYDLKNNEILSKISTAEFLEQSWEHFIIENCMEHIYSTKQVGIELTDMGIMRKYLEHIRRLAPTPFESISAYITSFIRMLGAELSLGAAKIKIGTGAELRNLFRERYNYDNAKEALYRILKRRGWKILFLVDDIDVNLRDDTPTELAQEFFLGLINATRSIVGIRERRQDGTLLSPRIQVKAFIPSDVYYWLHQRHADKQSGMRYELVWQKDELYEMFVERLKVRMQLRNTPSDIVMRKYLGENIYDEYGRKRSAFDYIVENTLYRPRDILNIYLSIAKVLETKKKITDYDFYEAISGYNTNLVGDIIDEVRFVFRDIEEVLMEMRSMNAVYSYQDLHRLLTKKTAYAVDPKRCREVIKAMYNMGMFGVMHKRPQKGEESTRIDQLNIEYSYNKRIVNIENAYGMVAHPVFRMYLTMKDNTKDYFEKNRAE